ncbi:hypothetical protein BH23BAC3_BH23BAC3_14470 [soil metagenome]
MIRLSLFYLFISAGIGGLLLAHKAINIHPMIWAFLPFHYELAVWGWLVQFVMGTAYWMFPKKLEGERRGPAAPAWGMVILFNTGLALLATASLTPDLIWTLILGRSLIAISILTFASLIWHRIVTYRNL